MFQPPHHPSPLPITLAQAAEICHCRTCQAHSGKAPLLAGWISTDSPRYPSHLLLQHFSRVFASPLRAAQWPLQGSAPVHVQHAVVMSTQSSYGALLALPALLEGALASTFDRFLVVSLWTHGALVNAYPLLLHLTLHSIHHTHPQNIPRVSAQTTHKL